jgi:hypothetical protein
MNGVRQTEEITRAKDEMAKLVDCLKSRRVKAFSRERLLRVQTDLAVLMTQLGEVQRIVSVCMIQRGPSEVAIGEAVQSPAPAPIALRLEALVEAADESAGSIDSIPLDWR